MTNLQVLISAHNKLWKIWYRMIKWNGRLRKKSEWQYDHTEKILQSLQGILKNYLQKKTHCNQIIEFLRKSYIIKLKT